MQLSAKRQRETGAFYTPKVWADKAAEYLKEFIGKTFEDCIFWDCAGGEGALLEALPNSVRRIGTTLENEDVTIMKNKGIEAYQFDFLDGNFQNLPFWDEVKNNTERLVILTNPPYVRLPASNQPFAKIHYKNNVAEELFIYRICLEINPKWLAIFTKAGLIQLAYQLWADTDVLDFFVGGFASCSKQGWGLNGNFGILFSLFHFDFERYKQHYGFRSEQGMKGLYYTYWAENPHLESVTRTDLENLGQYVEKFHVYN